MLDPVRNRTREEKTAVQKLLVKRFPDIPIKPRHTTIPERPKHESVSEEDSVPQWFFIQSPREIHGVVGPKTVREIRSCFSTGLVHDGTLVWCHGMENWQSVRSTPNLRNRIFDVPPIPLKESLPLLPLMMQADEETGPQSNQSSLQLPRLHVPTKPLAEVNSWKADWGCARCGNHAVSFGVGSKSGAYSSELQGVRSPVGSTQNATEMMADFLWIGNTATGRSRNYEQMQITLAINCSEEIKSLPDRRPLYRCKTIPLRESPEEGDLDKAEYFKYFELVYEWIELERLSFDLVDADSLVPPPYRGPIDEFGDPVKTDSKHDTNSTIQKWSYPRVLLYSRLGTDRPCMMFAAYIIRRWGVSVEAALAAINDVRVNADVSRVHTNILREWANMHMRGDLYCEDCLWDKQVDSNGRQDKSPFDSETENSEGLDSMSARVYSDPDIGRFVNLCKGDTTLSSLGATHTFIRPVPFESDENSATSSFLFDLILGGKGLEDEAIESLIAKLVQSKLIHRLREIRIQNNRIASMGVVAMVDALLKAEDVTKRSGHQFPLEYIDLSHNRVDEVGAKSLALLMSRTQAIKGIDVTSNALGDAAGALLVASLEGEVDFAEDEVEQAALGLVTSSKAAADLRSIVELKISGNNLGPLSATAVANVLRTNRTLTALHIDCNPTLSAKEMKTIMTAITSYNRHLQVLSVADIPLSVQSAQQLNKVITSPVVPLHAVSMARCGLQGKHLKSLREQIGSICHLTSLDVSGNPIGDAGALCLAGCIQGILGLGDQVYRLPLQVLDVNGCGLSAKGATWIVQASACAKTVQYLDLSDNNLGSNVKDLTRDLVRCRLSHLFLNRCKLGTKGTSLVLRSLRDDVTSLDPVVADPDESHSAEEDDDDGGGGNIAALPEPDFKPVSYFLKYLQLSGNEIKDSISTSLQDMLLHNDFIQHIDLGFNCLTETFNENMGRSAFEVLSNSSKQRKVNELNISFIGNSCGTSAIEMPGHYRSKSTLRYLSDEPIGVAKNALKSHKAQIGHSRRGLEYAPLLNINTIA